MNYHQNVSVSPYGLVGATLVSNGYSAIPIAPGAKRPAPCLGTESQRYCSRLPTKLEIENWSARPVGAGVALGVASRGLVAIDIDSNEVDVIEAIESRWPSTVRKVGRKGYSAFYWASPAVRSRAFKSGSHGGVDFLAHGRQTVLPPTIHPDTGEAYRWLTPRTLENIAIEELPMLPDDIAAQLAEALEPFGFEMPPERPALVREPADADNEWTETNATALAHLSAWVPDLGIGARGNDRGYRAQARWRNGDGLNVGFHPTKGIKDFAADKPYSAINIVAEIAGVEPCEAMRMLRAKLGLHDPEPIKFNFRNPVAAPESADPETQTLADDIISARERFPANVFVRHFSDAMIAVGRRIDEARPSTEARDTAEFIATSHDIADTDRAALAVTEARDVASFSTSVADWLEEEVNKLEEQEPAREDDPEADAESPWPHPGPARRHGVWFDDFVAYLPAHQYIFKPTCEVWAPRSVDVSLPKIKVSDKKTGKETEVWASHWLDRNQHVEQMTWAPGKPILIEDRLVADGGWMERRGMKVFNHYRPPSIEPGDASKAGRWTDHVEKLYPVNVDHIIRWLAFKVQHPEIKINHALVLGGKQGIGKDTILTPVKHAVGSWNFTEVKPTQILGRFNGFLKSVILRVSEVRDLGDSDRFAFYEHMKDIIAAPPDVLRVDEKHLREYSVFNVVGVAFTTNHKTGGIYLPGDDRRHYVAWSDLKRTAFAEDYFPSINGWFEGGGNRHVAAYLSALDLAKFNPKAPPPQTPAFWEIVDAGRSPEDAPMADALDRLGNPDAVTLGQLAANADEDFALWLGDHRNRRMIPHRVEACGYVAVRNPGATDGLWKIKGARQAIYARQALSIQERGVAAADLVRWCST